MLPTEHLAVDAMNAYDAPRALAAARALAPHDLWWLEDICDPLDFETHAAVAAAYEPPIAAGEALFSAAEARLLDRHGGLRRDRDILLFDPVHCYGIPNTLEILRDLEGRGWPRRAFWPHGGHLFTLHVAAALGLGGAEMNPLAFAPFGGLADGTAPVKGRVRHRTRPASVSRRRRTWPVCFAPCWMTEETSMAYTLETFAAAAHDLLTAEPGPTGREKVRSLLESVLKDDAFVARHLTDDVPERKILYTDPQLGFCILAHNYRDARESKPHDHGPSWAIYGQAQGETMMNDWALVEPASEARPGKVRHVRTYPLKPGMAHVYNEGDLHSPRRDGPTRLIRIEGTNMDKVKRLSYERV